MRGSRDPLLEFWDPPNVLGINEARNFKFGQKGSFGVHVTHFWNFWDSPNISGMNEARNFKFGSEMKGSEY